MTVFPLLAVGFIMKAVAALFVVCCVSLILIILIQKGRGGGLSGAFGGAMASGILGSKTGDFLTWVTIVLAGVFLTVAVVMAKFYKPDVSEYGEVTPAGQVQPVSPEQSSGSAGMEPNTVNTPVDANSPGS
ncbi:MAG: preprotein translocase subunit SecG [Planctomycetota bacterium]|jgi:preprotein translocase subunit SecG